MKCVMVKVGEHTRIRKQGGFSKALLRFINDNFLIPGKNRLFKPPFGEVFLWEENDRIDTEAPMDGEVAPGKDGFMKRLAGIGAAAGAVLILAVASLCFGAGHTTPILDEEGNPKVKSVSALESIQVGGMEQWLLMRGEDETLPVLLWLHGGPGAAQMPMAHAWDKKLEKEFIVVHWDQRGAGKSNPVGFDESTMCFKRFLEDAQEVTGYLQRRFGKDRIFLLGHSWGTQLGLALAASHPEDYHAYIGVSQVVNGPKAQEEAYGWLLGQTGSAGGEKDVEALKALGSPPYEDHETYVSFARMIEAHGGGMDLSLGDLAWTALKAPEYRGLDYKAWLDGANRGAGPMWEDPLCTGFDAYETAPALSVPVWFFCGRRDYNTPVSLVEAYCGDLEAEKGKALVVFPESAHTPFFAEPDRFAEELVRVKEAVLSEGE